MNTPKPYTELVSQAELAVSAVKDAELRRVAFEKILDDLLLSAGGATGTQTSSKAGRKENDHVPVAGRKTSPKSKGKSGGPRSYIDELVEEDFFAKQRTIAMVKAELQNRGHHIPLTSLSGPLQKLCQKKILRRQKPDGTTFAYSNW